MLSTCSSMCTHTAHNTHTTHSTADHPYRRRRPADVLQIAIRLFLQLSPTVCVCVSVRACGVSLWCMCVQKPTSHSKSIYITRCQKYSCSAWRMSIRWLWQSGVTGTEERWGTRDVRKSRRLTSSHRRWRARCGSSAHCAGFGMMKAIASAKNTKTTWRSGGLTMLGSQRLRCCNHSYRMYHRLHRVCRNHSDRMYHRLHRLCRNHSDRMYDRLHRLCRNRSSGSGSRRCKTVLKCGLQIRV